MAKYIFTTALTFSTLITIQENSMVFVQADDNSGTISKNNVDNSFDT